jgi:hypothetical protein
MTDNTPAKAAAAPAKAAAAKKPKDVLFAVHSINGVIAPGTPFTGPAATLKELLELGAARKPEGEAEEALVEKLDASIVSLGTAADDIDAALEG